MPDIDELTEEQLEELIKLNPEAWLEYALEESPFNMKLEAGIRKKILRFEVEAVEAKRKMVQETKSIFKSTKPMQKVVFDNKNYSCFSVDAKD